MKRYIDLFTIPDSADVHSNPDIIDIKKYFLLENKALFETVIYHERNSLNKSYAIHLSMTRLKLRMKRNAYFFSMGKEIDKRQSDILNFYELMERLSLFAANIMWPRKYDIFNKRIYPNKRFEVTSSNGVSAHTSFENAALCSTIELLERDTMLFYWFTKTAPNEITDINNKHYYNFKRYYKKKGINIGLFELPYYRGIVTFLVLYEDTETRIKYVSFSSHIKRSQALKKALYEGYLWTSEFLNDKALFLSNFIDKMPNKHFETDHLFYYLSPKRSVAFDFISETISRKKYCEINKNGNLTVYNLLKMLKDDFNVRIEYYLSPVIKRFVNQYICVKAASEDLQELFWGSCKKQINKKRFLNHRLDLTYPHPIV